MATPLYPLIEKYVDDAWVHLDRAAITPWSFLTAGPLFQVKDFYGKTISFQGVAYDGSVPLVFWGRYIEPFLEDIVAKTVQETIRLAEEKQQDARSCLPEAAGLLKSLSRRAFDRMAEIDQRLRGKGYPQQVPRRDVSTELHSMEAFIDRRLTAELAMVKPKSCLNSFYHDHPFLFWFLALLIGSVVTFLA